MLIQMASFIGNYTCKADSKCRVMVPASFRKVLASSQQSIFVLRRNVFERCIDMYPAQNWEEKIAELRGRLNLFNPKHVAFLREFCRGTQEVEMDASGRILLPRRMLEEVGIDKELVFAAQDTLIQLWDVAAYEKVTLDGAALGKLAEEILGKE